MTENPNFDTTVRLTALDRALQAWEQNKDFPSASQKDFRTPKIIATAKVFEAYLRGSDAAPEAADAPDRGAP